MPCLNDCKQTHTIFGGISPVGAHFFKLICFLFASDEKKVLNFRLDLAIWLPSFFCTKIIYNHRRETVAQQLFFTSFSDFVSENGYLCACTPSDFNKLTTNCLQFYILFLFTSSLSLVGCLWYWSWSVFGWCGEKREGYECPRGVLFAIKMTDRRPLLDVLQILSFSMTRCAKKVITCPFDLSRSCSHWPKLDLCNLRQSINTH